MKFLSALFLLTIIFSGSQLANAQENKATIDAAIYESLQEAFDAVPEAGGLVNIPPGQYIIKQPLIIKTPDTRIQGSGTATHIINESTNGSSAIILQPDGYQEDQSKRLWRVQLADFRVEGNEQSGDGIQALGINEIYLHGMSIDHNGGHGIALIDCYEDPRVSDNIVTYNKKAGLHILRGHDIVVNANQFEENHNAVECIDSFNLCMNGNNLDDHLNHGVVIENTYGSVLSGNMIEECQQFAIVMDRDCYGNTISANVIAHNFGGGIHLKDSWGSAISANTFTMNKPYSMVVEPDSGRLTITGNNFSNAYIGGENKRDDAAGGIHLKKTSYITITGNIFTGITGRSIYNDGENKGIVIQSNVMGAPFAPEGEWQPFVNLRPPEGLRTDNWIEKQPD